VALAILEELREALREQYAVESEVGRGGMATVFVAEDLKHGRRVAIKVLSPELSSSMDGDRFKREIQIAARLSHPHILPVFDSGDANGLLYYVMPFVEGESLRGKLKRETQLPIEDAIAITCEVADALAYAHSFGVVHRDIKPENILLHGGHAVVADFGIARVIQEAGAEKLTQTGMSVGTAAYMSPEQFSGENIDGRSDMYSLACVLYEMLVGEVPFTGPNAIAIMARHTMELPPSIQIVRGTVPDELEGAVMHALEKVPADRFATVAQFKEAVLGHGATSTYARRTRAYTKEMRGTRGFTPVRRRRRTLVLGAAGMVLLAVATLAARYFWHPGGPIALPFCISTTTPETAPSITSRLVSRNLSFHGSVRSRVSNRFLPAALRRFSIPPSPSTA
jgi:serine/threonine protein kinase